jgi:lysylphosphatidylglycerol synthetase-like protein (DUF2156 family)
VTRKAWIFALGVLLGGAFYLLLVDTTSSPELYVLAATAILAAIALSVSREQKLVEALIKPGWLLGTWRVLVKIPPNIAVLFWEAGAQLVTPRRTRGAFRAVPFRAAEATPEDTGRRALTEWLGSLAPNTIVVGVDAERRLLLVHQLRRQGQADEIDPMGLG